MPFQPLHAPSATISAQDACLVVQADRLLAWPDASHTLTLPRFSDLAAWGETLPAPLHLGLLEGVPHWAFTVENAELAAPPLWQWHDTRALLGVLTPGQSHAIACARQLLWFNRRHRFCGICGAETAAATEERARRCPRCSALFFPVVSPAVIVAITRGDSLLLAHNRNFKPGMFSLLAGFVDAGETLEHAVVREIREEVGIEVGELRYITSQPWPFPNSLMVGFRARHATGEIQVDGKEISDAGWFKRSALPEIPRVGTVARQLIDSWAAERQ